MARYVDIPAITQVIGSIYKNPKLIDDERYFFNEDDFTEDIHKVIFGSIYNLHQLGAKEITPVTIVDYLEQKPKKLAIYESKKGTEYLQKLSENSQYSAFDYYYNRMKKMTLLRVYKEKAGMDLTWLYDIDNIFDVKKKQAQDEWLDNTPLTDIADIIDKKVTDLRAKYVEDSDNDFIQAGDGLMDLLERLKKKPEVGYPMFGEIFNTILNGLRLKKFYLRSAATGVGKTRAMIGDACFVACDEIYDLNENKWVPNGTKESTIYIATEQEEDELQTMMTAFISGVDEDHIINSKYEDGEWERVVHAAQVIKNSGLHIKKLPDFSMQDIENTIKYGIREWGARYIFFDYLHSSMKILGEVSSKTGVKGLREDNILFMISIRLKDLCNQYGVFIMTATQLNADYVTAQTYDQNLLRGAKAIADKIDAGMIMLQVSQDDKGFLEPIVAQGYDMPNIKVSIYKNRRGRWKDVLVWCKADRGICRFTPLFVTNYQYELIGIIGTKISVTPPADCAF